MKFIFILLLIVAFFACNEGKTQEQIFETNVKACMQPLLQKNVDSLLADSACRCMINFIYEKDSTFFTKNPIEQKKIFDKYESEIINIGTSFLKGYRKQEYLNADTINFEMEVL